MDFYFVLKKNYDASDGFVPWYIDTKEHKRHQNKNVQD